MVFSKRPAKPHRYVLPSRTDIQRLGQALLNGTLSREAVAEWASEYVAYEDAAIYPEVTDKAVHSALVYLTGYDLRTSPELYLHSPEDLRHSLGALQS